MKKFLFILFSLLLFTSTAMAATSYGFEVAGISITSDNCNNITSSNISGTVYYVASTNTLYLNNATISVSGSYNRCINNLECSGLKIVFSGTCNLRAQDASVVRIRKNTTLSAPSASTVVNITGVNDVGIWMATENVYNLNINGPGTFNISSTAEPAISDEQADAWDLDQMHYVYFDNNVNAVLSSAEDNVISYFVTIINSGSVRFKATNNSSKPVIWKAGVMYPSTSDMAWLEPYGGYSSNGYAYDADGNDIYDQDIYISDNYALLLNSTNFPDAVFLNYMVSLYPKRYLTSSQLNNLTSLNVSGKNISDMTGIEKLTALKELRCYNCSFTSLNLNSNTALTYLDCAPNTQLTSLNIASCTNLETLICYNTGITSLSIYGLSNLKKLTCNNTKLTSLSVTLKPQLTSLNCANCTSLATLNCYEDALTYLNVSGCTALTSINCKENSNLESITGLDDCTALKTLNCQECGLTSLSGLTDISTLEWLNCSHNQLTSLTLNNKPNLTYVSANDNTSLTSANISSNGKLASLFMYGCESLTNLKCYSNALTTLSVYSCTALQNLQCYYNANLEKILGLSDCYGITYLDCEDCAITDLSSVQYMSNIGTLLARNNQLTTLTVSGKSNLKMLRVSGNTSLTKLDCNSNALTSLNVTGCSAMTSLDCHNNQLTSLSVSDCNALTSALIYQNKISGTGMTTLVNSLPTRSSNNKGTLFAIYNYNENNSMTAAQITDARNKNWLPCRYFGANWVVMTGLQLGDVNGDGSVDISDVTALIDYLLSGSGDINTNNADCNHDGNIDISDVTALIDYLLNGSWN